MLLNHKGQVSMMIAPKKIADHQKDYNKSLNELFLPHFRGSVEYLIGKA